MVKSRLSLPLFVCLFMLPAADAAFAQDRHPLEVSGGYQYVLDIDVDDDFSTTAFKNGFYTSAAWNVVRRLAAVGEFSQSATTIEVGESARFAPIDRTIYTTMGGVRYRFGGLFVQALYGQFAVRTQAEQVLGTLDETITEMAFQPGIGFDVAEGGRVWGRIQVDYRRLISDAASMHEFRIGAGVVVGLGGR